MANIQFEDFFKKSRDEIPEPKPLPRGHYILALRGNFKRPPREEGKSGQLALFLEAVEPCDDVDPAELEAYGEGGLSIKEATISVEFWLGDWSDVKAIFDHLALYGVDVASMSDLSTALKAATNKRIVGHVGVETYMHKVKGLQWKHKVGDFQAIQ